MAEEKKAPEMTMEPKDQLAMARVDSLNDAIPDYTPPELLYGTLLKHIRKYHPSDNLDLIEKAYRVAYEAHKPQKRKSGEPYIIHPINVAIILADLELDKETIAAGLLHDVVEDTPVTLENLRRDFGDEIAEIVDGVTKLTNISIDKDKVEEQAETLRKMFLAMARDIRVIFVKLADRLHNMRTLQFQKPEKQQEKARETMDIYSPIAHRLGISKIKIELDDLSFMYLKPDIYKELVEKVALQQKDRMAFVAQIENEISERMADTDIHYSLSGRVKHYFSIYKKMVNQHKTLDQIYDIFAVRILVDSVQDCYAVLGLIHSMYRPIPARFKDYIAMPKPNMYQSLHTTLMSTHGQPFEIQIRTYEMHRTAEYGIAAHWKYKEAQSGIKNEHSEEEKLAWLRQVLEWQKDETNNREFLSLIKNDLDLFSDNVFCFTPNGDVKNLPVGSTPIDFAYSIHSAVGNKLVSARVNGTQVPIDYQLQNGDRVEIITSANSTGPKLDWLNIVKSAQAKSKINYWFKHEKKDENIQRGKELLVAYCKTKNLSLPDLTRPEFVEKVTAKYSFKDWESVLAAVGHGGLKEGQVINKLLEERDKKHRKEITDNEILQAVEGKSRMKLTKSQSGIVVNGVRDLSVRFSHCCNPVPGDEIVGFITRGRGITIHRSDCANMQVLSPEERGRLMEVEWERELTQVSDTFTAEINIYVKNRIGVMVDISRITTENKIDLQTITSRVNKQGIATVTLSFQVKDKEELGRLVDKLRNISGVIDIERGV